MEGVRGKMDTEIGMRWVLTDDRPLSVQVVTNAVRQLQHAVTERGAIECVELFQAQHKKNGAGGLCRTSHLRAATELTYQRRAEAILQDENCFRVYIVSILLRPIAYIDWLVHDQ